MIPLLALIAAQSVTDAPSESPRSMVVEAKLGPWTPLIDRGFSSPGPYKTIFGDSPMLLGEAVLEYQFFQRFGSAAGAASIGYAEKFGRAVDPEAQAPTSQSTGLIVVPVKAYLAYRFDVLDRRWRIPLVPYLKAGATLMRWWSVKGPELESARNESGAAVNGIGTKFGYFGTAGVAFTLDFLDQRLARDFDSGMGVNHTYLFGEFTAQEMTNFRPASGLALDLSSRHWMFGLAFEL